MVTPRRGVEVEAEVQRRVAARGHISLVKQQYGLGSAYAGKIVTVRIDASLVQCWIDGELIKTFPRRHVDDVTRLSPDKKHRSRRAADALRRATAPPVD
jgi:hypothetical protein